MVAEVVADDGETSAITAFVLAVVALMGFVGFPVAEALVGFSGGPETMVERTAIAAMVVLLVVLGSCWLSQQVLDVDRLDDDVEEEVDVDESRRRAAPSGRGGDGRRRRRRDLPRS